MTRCTIPPRPTSTHFFSVRLLGRNRTLLTDHIDLLRRAVKEVRESHPFAIDAWVVLPDHMHAVWSVPVDGTTCGQRWGAIKGKFTRGLRSAQVLSANEMRAAKEVLGHAGVWQPGVQQMDLVSEAQRYACVTYCWGNPVKHGLVAEPHDWPFSSIHRDQPRMSVAAQ